MVGDVKNIFVIQSLGEGEIQSGYELYYDVIARNVERLGEKSHIKAHKYFDVKSKSDFLEILKYIAFNARFLKDGVVIHLETHGSERKDGLVLSDKSLISWKELVETFREINIHTNNNLYITMATCYGRFLFEGVDPNLKSPYSGYISASKVVLADDIIESFSEIFYTLISEGNLIKSYLKATAEGGSFFYKDSKTTFDQLMSETKYRLYNDPSYRQEVLDEPFLKGALDSGLVNESFLERMIESVFYEIYEKQKKAFEFSDTDS